MTVAKAITPMFSEYVVLGGPPTAVESMEATPSAEIAVPSW